ncbi:MAG TPA: cyclopropane fatty acyl phospholipid synthase [Candidatus Saccharimonadales bacterium]|nr:cyclopropane fatty acyl phospholipid synthase [Candidatus Saccharimonadales bacterium]
MDQAEKTVKDLLQIAGIKINGRNPWDIQLHDNRFYKRILTDGSLGLGESYMEGWWDSRQLDETMSRIMTARLDNKIKKSLKLILFVLKHKLINVADKKRAFKVGQQHYDFGNELYENMLDPDLNYSCGYWKGAKNLQEAQIAKLDLICRKMHLKKGMRVLDIGCGWGNFARHAAKNYGVEVVGITVSKEQSKLAQIRCKDLPVTIKVMDYRDLKEKPFDRIVSIGMFEHVTYKNYDTYMRVAESMLKQNGLFLLHTIGLKISQTTNDPWADKYIFPNSLVPSLTQIAKAVEGKFIIEDVHNFGYYYFKTLMEWYKNFEKNWPKLQKMYPEKYNQTFYRMWKYYLLASAGGFKARNLQLFQIVLSKNDIPEVYQAIR